MAQAAATIPVSPEVAEVYAASAAQIQQDIQRMLSHALTPGVFSLSSSGANNRACYEQDFYAWTQQTAALIRTGQWSPLDQEALAEEVEDLGVSQHHAVSSDLYQVLIHLLKWQYQSRLRVEGHSWQDTIVEHRDRIERLCTRSPSLRRHLQDMLTEEYPRARRRACLQTGLTRTTFPEQCPWTLDQVLDPDFWPGTP
jgi:Domain of unknown function DUF29.